MRVYVCECVSECECVLVGGSGCVVRCVSGWQFLIVCVNVCRCVKVSV